MFDIERVRDEMAAVTEALDTDGLDASRARRVFEAAAEIERLAANTKTLAAKRLDETTGWQREGDRTMAHYVARKTGTSLAQATDTVKTAARVDAWGATAAAMKAGKVSVQQAHAITDAVAADPHAEGELLALAVDDTVEGLRNECRRVKAAAASDPMARHQEIHRHRRAHAWPDADGAFRVEGSFTPEAGAALWARVESDADALAMAARKTGVPVESPAAYRADALVALATGAADGMKVRKIVTVRAQIDARPWLTGDLRPGETCEIVGAGPVAPDVMADFAVDALVYGIVERGTDVTHIAKLGGEIPDALRRAVLARDPECILIDCHETHHLEIDHTQPRAREGPHSIGNLKPLCRFHHILKTYERWKLCGSDEGGWHLVPPDDHDPPATDDPDPPGNLKLAI